MSVSLYYLDLSPPARSVDLVIHALGLKTNYKTVNLFDAEHLSPEYSKLHPLRVIPTIIDEDGFVLWESRAIMTYLVSKYGKDDSLYPKDLKKRAIVDQRLHFSNDVFFILKQTNIPILFHNAKTIPEEQFLKIKEAQENVEKLLVDHKFMAGDSLTVADYSLITIMDALAVYCPMGDKYPLTKAWFERCKSAMKDFEEVNSEGAKKCLNLLKNKLKELNIQPH